MVDTAERLASWGLIGPGHVGGDLIRQLNQDHVSARLQMNKLPDFVIRRSGIFTAVADEADPRKVNLDNPHEAKNLDEIADMPDVTFVTMPTTDDGEVARDHILRILDRGKMVVTAEKGALANYFGELESASDGFRRLGVNAAVGGGTRILDIAKIYCTDPGNITQIHLALNGTLSAIMSAVGPVGGSGMSLDQAVSQAVRLEFAEPGASSSYEVIRGEAEGDIPKKTSIFFNKTGLGGPGGILDWKDLEVKLTDNDIDQAMEDATRRRFIVSLYADAFGRRPETSIIGRFETDHAGWKVVGGFREIGRNPLFHELSIINGPGSGMVIGLGPRESDGVYRITGDGAGVGPTANAMIDNYSDFVARR